jgi:acylphosphatase
MARIAERIRVEGKVQGVFYRASTQEKARELGVAGWVRNESDGSVLIEAEGEEEDVKALAQWCWQGPSAASVKNVEEEPADPKDLTSFEIVG